MMYVVFEYTSSNQMVKGCYAGNDWNQSDYENYIQLSKEKLLLMNRKPIKVSAGKYKTWFEAAAVADFLGMFSWNGLSEASLRRGVVVLEECVMRILDYRENFQ